MQKQNPPRSRLSASFCFCLVPHQKLFAFCLFFFLPPSVSWSVSFCLSPSFPISRPSGTAQSCGVLTALGNPSSGVAREGNSGRTRLTRPSVLACARGCLALCLPCLSVCLLPRLSLSLCRFQICLSMETGSLSPPHSAARPLSEDSSLPLHAGTHPDPAPAAWAALSTSAHVHTPAHASAQPLPHPARPFAARNVCRMEGQEACV